MNIASCKSTFEEFTCRVKCNEDSRIFFVFCLIFSRVHFPLKYLQSREETKTAAQSAGCKLAICFFKFDVEENSRLVVHSKSRDSYVSNSKVSFSSSLSPFMYSRSSEVPPGPNGR